MKSIIVLQRVIVALYIYIFTYYVSCPTLHRLQAEMLTNHPALSHFRCHKIVLLFSLEYYLITISIMTI